VTPPIEANRESVTCVVNIFCRTSQPYFNAGRCRALSQNGQDPSAFDDQVGVGQPHIAVRRPGVHAHDAGAVDNRLIGHEPEDGLELLRDDPGSRQTLELPPSLHEQHALAVLREELGGPQAGAGCADYDGVKSFCHASPIFHAG
jgi:hypothetical protein